MVCLTTIFYVFTNSVYSIHPIYSWAYIYHCTAIQLSVHMHYSNLFTHITTATMTLISLAHTTNSVWIILTLLAIMCCKKHCHKYSSFKYLRKQVHGNIHWRAMEVFAKNVMLCLSRKCFLGKTLRPIVTYYFLLPRLHLKIENKSTLSY